MRRAPLVLLVLLPALSSGASAAASSPDSSAFARGLDEARAALGQGHYAEAESLGRELLGDAEASRGERSAEAAAALDVVVEALTRGGKSKAPETRELAERAIAIKEERFGPGHPELVKSLSNYAGVLSRNGDYAAARPVFERALAIAERSYGPEHAETARCLNNLGILLWQTGEYSEATTVLQRALAIRERTLGPDHTDVAGTLSNLAIVAEETGDYARALPLLERALAIREKVLGEDHPDVARVLNNLGRLRWEMGEYAEARSAFERALAIKEKALGPDHPEVATGISNLALQLEEIGEYKEAASLYERALAASEKALGPEHPQVAAMLYNLGHVRAAAGDLAEARRLQERALAIREKSLGPEHPQVAQSLGEIASLLEKANEDSAAEALYARSETVLETALGPDHPDLGPCLQGMARVDMRRGDTAAAKRALDRALTIEENALGSRHPEVAKVLEEIAALDLAMGDREGSVAAALRAEAIGREHLRLTARSLAEREALRYAASRPRGLDEALSVVAGGAASSTMFADAWDAAIRSRALVLDEMASRHRAIAEPAGPEIARLAEDLAAARTRLANITVRGPGNLDPERYRHLLESARSSEEEAERALASKSGSFRAEQDRSEAGLREISAALPSGWALVAYARYDRTDADAARSGAGARGGSPSSAGEGGTPSYLAFVLRRAGGEPDVVPLGRADEIDPLVARWSDEAGEGATVPSRSAAESETAYRDAGTALRAKIWDPIASRLEGARNVFVVPDGSIHLVSFAALPAPGSGYLVETGPLLHELATERDLLLAGGPRRGAKGLLALGGAEFDSVGAPAPPGPQAPPGSSRPLQIALAAPYRGGRSKCGEFETARFDPLPGSAGEVDEVASLWKKSSRNSEGVLMLTGAAASEAAFKELAPGHSVLHLATHGFFLGAGCGAAQEGTRGIGGMKAPDVAGPPAVEENPLLLSGLALAGANARGRARPDDEDGILTAEEIASLDFSGVEWAVLSGCETGVGRIAAGEGVLGLRRAFQVAGARTVVMSLWAVKDESARAWMRALYDARLRKGLGTAEAARDASREVLAARRRAGESTHPFWWAAFVAAGDWR